MNKQIIVLNETCSYRILDTHETNRNLLASAREIILYQKFRAERKFRPEAEFHKSRDIGANKFLVNK